MVSNFSKSMIALAILTMSTYLSIRFVLPLLTPFVVAAFLAILIEPAVKFLEKKLRMPRGIGVFIVLLVLAGLLITGVSVGVAEIAREVDELSRNLGGLSKTVALVIENIVSRVTLFFEGLPAPFADFIASQQGTVVTFLESATSALAGLLKGFPQSALMFLFSVLATFFVSRDYHAFSERMVRAMPRSWRRGFGKIRGELLSGFVGYLRSRFVLMAITAVLTLFGLSIMGVNYAWLLALTCGVLDILPLLGPAGLFLPWAGYHFLMGNVGYAIGLLAVHGITSAVRQVAELRVMGKNMDLHPLVALISIYVGARLLGTKGLIAGPLSVIFIKAIYQSIINPMFPVEEE